MTRRAVRWLLQVGSFAILSADVLALPPAAPLVYATTATSDIVLTWTADPAATSYEVYRIDDLANPFVLLATVSAPPFLDAGALPGPPVNPATWFYRVVARNIDGPSPPSNMASKINLVFDLANQPPGGFPVSLPHFFFPAGLGVPPTARDLCLMAPIVIQTVRRINAGSCTPRNQLCAIPISLFNLVAGEGYYVSLSLSSPPSVPLDIVGSNDPDYVPGGARAITISPCDCEFTEAVPVSLPLSGVARTAQALCDELANAGQRPHGFRAYRSGAWRYHNCGVLATDFSFLPGEAALLYARETITWQPEVQ